MEAYKEQRSADWLAFRQDKIGGSDAPVVLGLSPWMSALDLWEEKKGLRGPRSITSAMQKGIDQENAALEFAQKTTNVNFKPDVKIYKDNNRIIASLDGINEEQKIICECKSSNRYFKMASEGRVFPDTYCQVQHQLLVTGFDDAILCCFNGIEGKILEIKKDQDFIDEMLLGELQFLKYLDKDTPPPVENAKKIEVSPFQQSALFNWMEVSKQLKELEKQEKELRNSLISMASSEDKVVLLYEGHPIVKLSKIVREGAVDWKTFCKDNGLTLEESEKYRKKPVSYYQLKVV